jgi:hypothetical protein
MVDWEVVCFQNLVRVLGKAQSMALLSEVHLDTPCASSMFPASFLQPKTRELNNICAVLEKKIRWREGCSVSFLFFRPAQKEGLSLVWGDREEERVTKRILGAVLCCDHETLLKPGWSISMFLCWRYSSHDRVVGVRDKKRCI